MTAAQAYTVPAFVPTLIEIAYLVAASCFIVGLKRLSSPKTARSGNVVGATGMLIAVVATLKVAHAAALKLAAAEVADRPLLNAWDKLMAYLHAALAREPVEHFRVLYLDNKNRLKADETQARGTVNHAPVYPREVVKRALDLQASAVILVHNHPSGDPSPSRADIDMTREVQKAAAALGIALHDHVIVGNGRWLSFRQQGLL